MFRVKYVYVSDRNPKLFQNKIKPLLIKSLFPFITGITKSRLGWVKYYTEKREYNFVQLAAHSLQRLYRRFLRQNASAALTSMLDDSYESLRTIDDSFSHTVCYNCRPSFCSFYTPNNKTVKCRRCRRRMCPSCHFGRARDLVLRLHESCKPVLAAWPSTFLHCYEAKFPTSVSANEIRDKVAGLVRSIYRRRNLLGLVWYFRPLYLKKKHEVIWRARLIVIASADFHLRDEEKQASGLQMKTALQVNPKNLVRAVGWCLAWGKYPFWFTEEIVAAWNQVLAVGRTFSCSGIAKKNFDKGALSHFYRLAAKARAKVLARGKRILRKDGSIKPQPPISLLRANQASFLSPAPPHP